MMERYPAHPHDKTLEDVIARLTTTRWAFRDPRPDEEDEAESNSSGLYPIAVRDLTHRAVCVGHEFAALHELHFSVWVEQVRPDEEADWVEISRFPRAVQVVKTERGWYCGDLCISASSNEWRYLAAVPLKELLDAPCGGT